jgi:hypothetical protein
VTATEYLSGHQFVEPIREHEARGNSRSVSPEEYQSLAAAGREHLDRAARSGQSVAGLDKHWDSVKADAYEASREPWGGRTINSRGRSVHPNANVYALTVRHPGQGQIHVPLDAPRDHFDAAMDTARARYGDQLASKGGHLGVFHDVDENRIDIDPVHIVKTRKHVEEIGAYTHAVGGAYHFRSGNGYFPPHVKG